MAAEKLVIRSARADDAEAIATILNAAIAGRAATAQLDPVDASERRTWLRAHDERHPVWVAEDGAGVAGWFVVSAWADRPAYDIAGEVGVYVAPQRQGRGTGAALLRHAITAAPGLGLEVYVGASSATTPPACGCSSASASSAGA